MQHATHLFLETTVTIDITNATDLIDATISKMTDEANYLSSTNVVRSSILGQINVIRRFKVCAGDPTKTADIIDACNDGIKLLPVR